MRCDLVANTSKKSSFDRRASIPSVHISLNAFAVGRGDMKQLPLWQR